MKSVPPWAWFCGPRTDLLTCDWRLGDWPRCGQPVTSIVTSRSPAPPQTLATSALMMLASSILQERTVNWTRRPNCELFLQPLLEATDESVFAL